jgi:endonuclease YncB( thermonuclease family)
VTLSSRSSAWDASGRAEVIDGDTIRIAGETVRLEGIDAPETRQECEDAAGRSYACGELATRSLGRLIARESVTCYLTGRDSYDRALGICESGGLEINAEMVRMGWALAFRRYSARYVQQEKEAEQARAGLWAGTFDPPWNWRAAVVAETPAGDCVIKGNISRSGERIYHMPFQQHYDRTKIDERAGEQWFCSEAEAQAAGWRRALR